MAKYHLIFSQKRSQLQEVVRVSKSILSKFPQGRILLGTDCRNSSKSIVSLLSSLLTAAGFDVSDAGLTPTPALRLAVRNFEYSGGIMVTGSAEPPVINGLKLFDSLGFPLTLSQKSTVVVRKTSWDKLGASYREEQVVPNYMRKLAAASLGPFKRHIKIVIDIGNGMQALAGPRIIENLGATVITLNGNIDGAFPSRGPGLSPKSLRALSEAVRSSKQNWESRLMEMVTKLLFSIAGDGCNLKISSQRTSSG